MITINFYTLQDRIPAQGEDVIYLRPTSSFGYYGFDPKETTAEYCWFAYDGQGVSTGEQSCYDPETESNFDVGDTIVDENEPHVYWKLEMMFDEWCVTETDGNPRGFLWTPLNEYWNSFESPKSSATRRIYTNVNKIGFRR